MWNKGAYEKISNAPSFHVRKVGPVYKPFCYGNNMRHKLQLVSTYSEFHSRSQWWMNDSAQGLERWGVACSRMCACRLWLSYNKWQGPSALKLKLAFPNPYPSGTMKNPTRIYKLTHSQIQTCTHIQYGTRKTHWWPHSPKLWWTLPD